MFLRIRLSFKFNINKAYEFLVGFIFLLYLALNQLINMSGFNKKQQEILDWLDKELKYNPKKIKKDIKEISKIKFNDISFDEYMIKISN
jgi:hypothetical protein